ncbi:MAG TPA: head GIN domain-containing protein, partial [Chitinophagaceae bacterium]
LMIVLSSCSYMGGKRVTGDGELSSENRTVGDFRGVEVTGSMQVIVSQGPTATVRVEADRNLHSYIVTELDGEVLEVRPKKGYNLRPRAHIKVYVTAPQYHTLAVTGSGKIQSTSKISGSEKLKVDVTGSGDIVADVDAPAINTEITGSGSITLNGNTRTLGTEITGSGEVHNFNLLSEATEIEISGSGNAEVYASKQLNIHIAGSGDVQYKGNPTVNQSVAGSGNIRKVQ